MAGTQRNKDNKYTSDSAVSLMGLKHPCKSLVEWFRLATRLQTTLACIGIFVNSPNTDLGMHSRMRFAQPLPFLRLTAGKVVTKEPRCWALLGSSTWKAHAIDQPRPDWKRDLWGTVFAEVFCGVIFWGTDVLLE